MQEEQPTSPSQEDGTWQFHPEGTQTPPVSQAADSAQHAESISWTASEFIAHDKNFGWYLALAAAAVVLMALMYLITRDLISSSIVLIMIICFGIFAARKPRVLPYAVDNTGVHIGEKTYTYDSFKSFSLIEEGAIISIMLIPLKRFMPPISIYMDPEDEQKIAEVLALYLPFEQRKQDAVDRLMRRLRF